MKKAKMKKATYIINGQKETIEYDENAIEAATHEGKVETIN